MVLLYRVIHYPPSGVLPHPIAIFLVCSDIAMFPRITVLLWFPVALDEVALAWVTCSRLITSVCGVLRPVPERMIILENEKRLRVLRLKSLRHTRVMM